MPVLSVTSSVGQRSLVSIPKTPLGTGAIDQRAEELGPYAAVLVGGADVSIVSKSARLQGRIMASLVGSVAVSIRNFQK